MRLNRLTSGLAMGLLGLTALTGVAYAETTVKVYMGQLYAPDSDPRSKETMDAIAAEYQALHPDTKIEFVPWLGGDQSTYFAWLSTRYAAGDEPDIGWSHYYTRNAEADRWTALNTYLDGPNEYVAAGQPGHDKWSDEFFDNVKAQIRASDGNWYQVNTNWVETGLFVNNDLMAKNGINTDWKTWTDFINSCKDLRAKGIQPLGVFATPGWSTDQWLDTLLISAAFADQIPSWHLPAYENPFMTARQLTPEEMAKATKDGKFSTKDPRFDTFLDLTKEVTDNCLVEGFAGITSLDQIMNLFFNDKVAMAWLGTWNAPTVRDTAKFSVTTTYFPPFTSENSKFLTEPTIYRVGGPSSSGQFGISSGAADRGTLDASVDFLKYLTAPAQAQRIAGYDEGNLPVIKGVEPAEVAKGFSAISQLPERGITDAVSRYNGEQYGTPHNRLLQSFMLGEISRDEMKTQYQALLDKAVADQCEANSWDWCGQ